MKSDNCLICQRIKLSIKNLNPYFVCELNSGFVVLGDHQYFRGYTLFLAKKHCKELHELPPSDKKMFLEEMSIVAEAVFKTFKPKKLNYELLGNTDPHLHWHIFPRHLNDLCPNSPIWTIKKTIRNAQSSIPHPQELEQMKSELRSNLKRFIK